MGRCIRFSKAASCLVGVLCSSQHPKLNSRNKTTVMSGKAQKALGPMRVRRIFFSFKLIDVCIANHCNISDEHHPEPTLTYPCLNMKCTY